MDWNRLNEPVFVAALLFRLTESRYFEKKLRGLNQKCVSDFSLDLVNQNGPKTSLTQITLDLVIYVITLMDLSITAPEQNPSFISLYYLNQILFALL